MYKSYLIYFFAYLFYPSSLSYKPYGNRGFAYPRYIHCSKDNIPHILYNQEICILRMNMEMISYTS